MDYKNKYLACLLGGAMGDALGYPIEFMSKSEIVSEYGENGIRDLSVDNKTGKSKVYKLYCETWYGEDSQIFVEGILIITKFKYRLRPVSLHLSIL